MKPRSPALAVGWEIWARHRAGAITVAALLLAGTLLVTLLAHSHSQSWASFAGPVAYSVTAIALIATVACFHFTEGSKKGGFGSFPTRLFHFPATTRTLVALPMIYGAASVVVVYLLCVQLLLRHSSADLPLLWPSLYLVFGLTQFQMILWSMPESRHLKLLCLGIAGCVITFGWMFFVPTIVVGALSDWGYPGSPDVFMQRLRLGLAFTGPVAYAISVYRVSRQRHASGAQSFAIRECWDRWISPLLRRRSPFRSADDAILWHEWRRTGWILPGVIAVISALTYVPAWLSGDLSERATIGVLSWLLIAVFLFAIVIGRGFTKPDFWSPSLKIAPFHAIKPVTAGQWVGAKLKAALLSAIVTWAVGIYLAILWTVNMANLQAFEAPIAWVGFFYTPMERWTLLLLALPALIILTWRCLLGGMGIGLSGSKAWYYALNTIVALFAATIFVLAIQGDDRGKWSSNLHRLWPVVTWLPVILTLAVVGKAIVASVAWSRAIRYGLVSVRSAARYWVAWSIAVGILAGCCFIVCRNTMWLRHLMTLGAIVVVPLAGPALAMRAWMFNRSTP